MNSKAHGHEGEKIEKGQQTVNVIAGDGTGRLDFHFNLYRNLWVQGTHIVLKTSRSALLSPFE